MYSIVTKYGYECGFMSILDACRYADKMLCKGYSEYNSFYIVDEYDSVVFYNIILKSKRPNGRPNRTAT